MEVYTWKDVEEERITETITRKMFWGENVMVTRWQLAPNTTLPEHSHVSEQVTMVESGSVTITFRDGKDVTLGVGDMLVIPPSLPHGVRVGPEGSTAVDIFSPIREDFIGKTSAYLGQSAEKKSDGQAPLTGEADDEQAFRSLWAHLHTSGIKATLDEVKQYPLTALARLAYERECVTLGQLRRILGLDKAGAKALLREWKHGDDHSASSLRKMMDRRVILPGDQPPSSRKK